MIWSFFVVVKKTDLFLCVGLFTIPWHLSVCEKHLKLLQGEEKLLARKNIKGKLKAVPLSELSSVH